LRDVPADVRRRLNLPAPDEGIDLIGRTRRGEYWAIQSKFRSQRDKPLNRRELGTFSSLAFNTCNEIALAVVAHTASKPVSKRHLMRNTVEIGLDRWQSKLIQAKSAGRSARPKVRQPRPHQIAAITAAKAHFISSAKSRGRLIMPCGTGKSLTAFWIADALKAKTILIAVPSLALIRQSVTDWTREYLAHNLVPDWICVCSDESVGNLDRDEFVGEVYDTGLPTHTDPKEIATLLRSRSNAPKIVFTTYQSSHRLAAAARKARVKFDLGILDEAHKTVGVHSKPFAALLSDKKVKIRCRVFMTATERVILGDRDDVLSMDNEKDYGERFFHLSFKEAIRQHIISDYEILTITVSNARIRELILKNRILKLNSRTLDEAEAQPAAAGIALKRVFQKQKITHAISFHRSIRSADGFREQQDALNRLRGVGPITTNFHISGKKTAGERSDLLWWFVNHNRALMTNARCLTEGVDVPAIDCVLFADPKQSRTDIVQAAGRAMRRYPGKERGYILLPLIVPDKMNFEDFAKTTAFRQVARTITALSTQDERIADELRAIEKGRLSSGKIIEIEGDVPVGMKMKLGEFANAISTRVWESVARVNFRTFEEARAFARALYLKNVKEWQVFSKSGKRPADIPSGPNQFYADTGWVSWGDWLGTGREVPPRGIEYRPFKEARAFAHGLNLKSAKEWNAYSKSGKRPDDIPAGPRDMYTNTGWAGWGDWLGTGRKGPAPKGKSVEFRPFKEARALVRRLKFKSGKEWRAYCKSGKMPADIRFHPERYADWVSWGDWLGTGAVRSGSIKMLPFKDARAFVRRLNLKSAKEWRAYCKSGKRPVDIPSNPNLTYADAGWVSWGDWVGNRRSRNFRSFKEARAFARGLNLKTVNEWRAFCKSSKKPADIPSTPSNPYADSWVNWGDWLGTEP
jgi:superfamily II DNA or RNA helicase